MTTRRHLLRIACLAALGGALAATATTSHAEASLPVPEAATAAAATPIEPLDVDPSLYTSRNLDWQDAKRSRPVPVKLYLPASAAEGARLPLVLFSHGIGGSREGYRYLGRYLASMGYASLHVQHVGSDRRLWSGNPFALVSRLSGAAQTDEALARVQDVKFALDQLLASEYSQRIDARRIAVAGHSYGANTTLLLAGASVPLNGETLKLRDPRVSAAIMLSAPPFYGLGEPTNMLAGIDIPTLHITATADDINIPGYFSGVDDRISIFKATAVKTNSQKVLAVFKEGSHSVFTDRMGTGGATLNPKIKVATRKLALAFLDRVFGQERLTLEGWQTSYSPLLAIFEARAGGAPGAGIGTARTH
ncbi:MAG: alpha/beta fold hydrolase [Betaproteobacteria bacterium]|nr:alpha/beta fold hydrolase [Betaproteobacteria bacterium]